MKEWISNNKGMSLVGISSILGIGLLWQLLSTAGSSSPPVSSGSSPSAADRATPGLSERLAQRREARDGTATNASAALQEIFARWDEAKLDLGGQDLLNVRREVAEDAVMTLGGSDGLLKFLEFLKNEGQGDLREWVITEGLKELFESPEKSPAAREWLLGIEDLKLQESLCFAAGRGFKGPGFKDYVDTFESIHSQSRLLAVCRT